MIQQSRIDVGGILRPPGTLDLESALAPHPGELGERAAAHLLRRAGFGGTPAEIARYAPLRADRAVAELLRMPPASSVAAPQELEDDGRPLSMAGDPLQRSMIDQEMTMRKGKKAERRTIILALQLWWLRRMLATPAPLQEKMTLYFHGHFTSRMTPLFPWITYNQNALLRSYALGNLRELTRAVSKDAAMLIYLNGAENVAAHPNENYARELMELFTLGVDHYTEADVRESARAWTGWRVHRPTDTVWFDASQHDSGSKTFLGRRGNFTGDDIVNIIFSQPQCAKFFANSLLSWFVYDNPEPALVDRVAELLRGHDFELAPVVATILSSNVFYGARAYRARVKSPVEFVIGTYKALGLSQVDEFAVPATAQMGQRLFFPPNVAGWPGGQNWLTSGTMIARQNFLVRLLTSATVSSSSSLAGLPLSSGRAARQIAESILQGDAAPAAIFELQGYLDGTGSAALAALSPENFEQRARGAAYLAMATPGYQLN
ncbi:MAG TPA: DUF1800 domain-containing protein [Candidatus Cybelea sp.]|nr:DUF1800 domain-containing protein [Candidatus Cybelea sp.]